MKKILASILIVASAGLAFGQPTNAIKISQLTTATVPLGGTELVPITQGGVTKSVTMANIWFNPNAYSTASSNVLQGEILSLFASASQLSLATNSLQSNVTALAGRTTLLEANTNSINATVAAHGSRLTLLEVNTNALQSQVTALSGRTSLLEVNTNALQTEINSINTQLGNNPTNGATVSFTRILTPAYTNSSYAGGSTTLNVDFSKGTFQVINIAPNNNSTITFQPLNFQNGDNIWLEVVSSGNFPTVVGSSGTVTGGTVDAWSSSLTTSMSGSAKRALLNWQCFGNSLVFTMAVHP